MILTFDGERIFGKFRLGQEDIMTITDYTERAIAIRITVTSESSYTKVFASGGSFQNMCG